MFDDVKRRLETFPISHVNHGIIPVNKVFSIKDNIMIIYYFYYFIYALSFVFFNKLDMQTSKK